MSAEEKILGGTGVTITWYDDDEVDHCCDSDDEDCMGWVSGRMVGGESRVVKV